MSSNSSRRRGSGKGETPKSKNSTESPRDRRRRYSEDLENEVKSNGTGSNRRLSSNQKETPPRPSSRAGKGASQKRKGSISETPESQKVSDKADEGTSPTACTFEAIDIIRENGSEYVQLQMFNGMPGMAPREHSRWDNLARGTISSSLKRLDIVEERPSTPAPRCTTPRPTSHREPTASSLRRSGSVTLDLHASQNARANVSKNSGNDASTLKRSVSNIDFNNKSAQKSVSNDIQRTPSNSSLNRSQSDLQKSRSGSGRYEKEYLGQVVKLRRPKHTEDTDDRRKSTDFDSPVTRRSKKSDNTSKRWSLHLDMSSTANFTGRKEIASPTVAKPKRRAPSGGDYSSASTTVLASTPVCSMDLDKVIQLFRVEIPGTIEEAKSENDVQTEKAWLEAEKVWLVHKGGFASSCVLKSNGMSPLPEGRVRIKLDHGGDILEVDEDDVEKANPPQFDRAEDLASLRYLNESSALHTLRQRYGANLIHTYAGNSLVVVNPMHPIAIYSDKVIQVFKGCKQEDMPPHIYASAQIAYRDMLNTRMDQSIILMGRSGSGKTCNARHVMNYFTVAAGSVGGILTSDKLQAVTSLLEAFGNSRTILNTNASRFSQLTTLDFDHSGQITSASIQVFLFEKTRVVRRPEGEPSFHVFYQMLAGIDSTLRSELQLTSLGEPNLFMTPLTRNEDRQKASAMWAKIFNAMVTIGISEEERKALCYVLAAIYHLGVAGAAKGQNNKSQFSRPAAAQKAAALLGVTSEELARQIFSSAGSSTLSRSASMRGSPADKGQNEANTGAMEALEGFVIGLYADVFNAIVSLINRSLSTNYRTSSSVTIVDMPGFQNPATCGRNTGSTFEDLCYNYTQEKLQLLYHDLTFTSQQDRYSQENIDCDFEFVTNSPSAMVSLIDKQAQQLLHRPSANRHHGNDSHHSNHDHLHHGHEEVRTSSQELKESDKKGLLWILDEEAIFPGATEDSFMDRFFTHHGEQKVKKDSLLRKASSLGNTFILNHFQGTNPVTYNASGWLKGCRENPLIKIATQVLQDSKRQNINELFNTVKAPVAGMVSGSIVGMEGSTSLKRVGSMRRTFMSGTAGLKKRSMCLQVKFQVDSIIETLRKSRCHFVHCILPQQNAGLWELKQTTPSDKPTDENLMNVPLVRAQIRGIELLDAVRMYRQGFPDSMAFAEFRHRFEGLLSPANRPSKDVEEKQAVATILDHLDIDKLNFRVGLSKVFFRAGALSQLEMARDEKIAGTIIALQARCRGYLGRKALEKLRIKHIAISCIQKNVRKLMLIKDWTWWKLFTKVQPLLDVHRTEEELKSREIELEQLKSKVERLEKDRTEYKTQCDKLESRLSEATADLAEEHETATHATEMLDAESAERMRLEKELKDIQAKYAALKRHSEKVEMEMTQLHLWQAQALEGDLDEDLGEGGDSIYKDRYERAMKELNVTRKRMEKQHEEDMEIEHNLKKAVEKRLHEAIEDAEDQRRQLQAAKKKASRLASEMQDTKLHLEEQMSRNNDLERKQRRFDSELNKVQEEIKEERHMREKIQRERDQLATDKIELEQEINRTKSDLEEKSSKVDRLNNELMDLTLTGTKGSDQEVMNLKKAKHELDMKVKEQEEELDDQAGQIQQLEQTKVRLEMNLERQRQSHMKEMEEKEEDIEEMRYSTQKKLKHIESQLEEEYEEKKKLQQDKRELERQMAEIGSKTAVRDKEGEKRLKRDLKKTKALLRDAETVLQKHRSSEGSKNIVRALRNKVDDAEFAAAAALKAKKTMELEIQDLQQQLDEVFRTKTESENKAMSLLREKTDIQNQLEENEEDLNETMRKYKAVVQQGTVDQITINDQLQQIEELTSERDRLKQEVLDLQTRVQGYEENSVDKSMVARLEGKIRDLENRLQLEVTAKHRLEVQVQRMKEQLDKLTTEKDQLNQSKVQIEELLKKNQRQLRDLREEFSETQKKEMEVASKNKTLETKVVDLEADFVQNQADLKLAFKRISDLQAALEEDLLSDGDSLLSDSDDDASDYSDDDGLHNHRSAGSSGRFNHLPVSPRSHQSLSSSSSHDYSSLSSSHTTNGASHA